jgi:hypothetical protein
MLQTLSLKGAAHRENLRIEFDPVMDKFVLTLFPGSDAEMNVVLNGDDAHQIAEFFRPSELDAAEPIAVSARGCRNELLRP